MKRITFFLIGIMFCGIFVYAISTDEQIRQAASNLGVPFTDLKQFVQSYQTSAVPTDAIEITATKLCEDYLANELRADNQYKGKTIRVTGVVNETKSDYKGYYVSLDGAKKNYMPYTINVYVKQSALNTLANLEKGQTITLIGKGSGKGIIAFTIDDATFVN